MCETVLRWSGASVFEHEKLAHQVVRGEFQDIDQEHYCGLEPLSSVLENIGRSRRVDMTLDEFAAMIKGDFAPERLFLAQLISSPTDVDRIDFIPRDTLLVGTIRGGLDIDSLVKSLVVVETTPEMTRRPWPASELAVDISGLTGFEAMLTTRDHMYAEIYSQAVNRAAQAMLVRATKRMLDDKTLHQRELARMTDEQLLSALEVHPDEYCKDVVRRIRTRQIFDRIPELEYMYDDIAKVWSEIYRYINNPELILKMEDEIGAELSPHLDRGQLIVDLPSPEDARLIEREALVRTRSGPQKLEMVSTLVRFFNRNALHRRWKMMVFAPLTREDPRYDKIVQKFRDRFRLGEPSEYPASALI
jgi:HD superfamily phosphohydrolase